jgi:bisphosphoglycerate-dependent phosphoglycerate mutase
VIGEWCDGMARGESRWECTVCWVGRGSGLCGRTRRQRREDEGAKTVDDAACLFPTIERLIEYYHHDPKKREIAQEERVLVISDNEGATEQARQ